MHDLLGLGGTVVRVLSVVAANMVGTILSCARGNNVKRFEHDK